MEREMKTVINRLGFAAPAFAALILASGVLSAGAASNTGGGELDDCEIGWGVCYKSCAGSPNSCFDDCDKVLKACKPGQAKTGSGPFSPKTGGHMPTTGGTKADPKKPPKPPKTGDHTPPTGGTKNDPKIPPKVNDTRAPLGGGVFGQKSSSSSGTSDPILRSSGAGQPIMKSNGGSGPNSKSGGGLR
jgi:hypothetical protein